MALDTIGDHLRKARIDRGLLQKEVARALGVSETAVHNWETGRVTPSIRCAPRIIRFIGYDPCAGPTATFPDRLRACRRGLGLSRKLFARRLRVDESTLARWETGKTSPAERVRRRIEALLERKTEMR